MGRIALTMMLGIAVIGIAAMPVVAQTSAGQKPSFEVGSIKLNTSGMRPPMPPANTSAPPFLAAPVNATGGRFVATNITLRALLQFAYRSPEKPLSNYQILGGPSWIDNDFFDVQAKAEGDAHQIPAEQMQLMVQSLLEDRFELRVRREIQELPVYNLLVVKGGSKMRLSEDQTPPDQVLRSGDGRGTFSMIPGPTGLTLSWSAAPISLLVTLLQGQADRLVIDKTGLTGLFDIQIHPGRDDGSPSIGAGAPSLRSSSLITFADQLGLKLESTKGPVEVLVIDSVQKPTEN